MRSLVVQALSTYLMGVGILGLLLFLPAGTLAYWQAWVFILVFMAGVTGIGVYLAVKDPVLLERRKKFGPAQEQSPVQRIAISIGLLTLLGVLIFSAVAHRFGWASVPAYGALVGDGLVTAGLGLEWYVLTVNRFSGSTVETVADQKVISTGPYAWVRHPMYVGVLIMVAGAPLALDAWWSLIILGVSVPALLWRIVDEEQMLAKELPGYVDYMRTVRYRLVPYLW